MEAEFYNIKTKLYLGLFSVKTLFMTSFALDATLRSSLGLLHGRKRAHCVLYRFTTLFYKYFQWQYLYMLVHWEMTVVTLKRDIHLEISKARKCNAY